MTIVQQDAYPGLLVPGLTYPSQTTPTIIPYEASQSLFVDRNHRKWRQTRETEALFWKNIKGDF